MAEVRLTPSQQAAVDHRGSALLVSAAAGSGKTKVLVDRLMAMVCDPVQPANLNEFLIITYTKAAASELRGKIAAELSRRLALRPNDRHLQHQMRLVYLTEISTVHAFCGNLLRTYGHVLEIPADFRVAEEAEARALKERCLEQVLEEAYRQMDSDPSLRRAVDVLGYGRDDRGIAGAVDNLYRAAQCHPDPDRWLEDCMAALDLSRYGGCAETPWGESLLLRLDTFLRSQVLALRRAMGEMTGIVALEKAYVPAFSQLADQLNGLLGMHRWDDVCRAFPREFPRLSPVRKFEDKEALERWKGVRSRCIEGLRDWQSVFYGPDAEVMKDLAVSAEALQGAIGLTRAMADAFKREKRRRRILDFGDLEHASIRLLTDRQSGRPTAVAREVAERYCEVLVDEYQDSNEVQERIFEAISRGGRNRFLVGDVKQSIYRFRLADPSIFLEKYKTYAGHDEAAPGEPCKILLSENFRSRPEILRAVNDVFRTVMSPAVGDLAYGDEEALKPGLTFPAPLTPPVELHCMEPGLDPEGVLPVDKGRREATFVAERIARLLAEETLPDGESVRPIRPEDIVILLRSVNSAASDYLEALHARGIPCVCDRGESVLDSREVETFLAILQVLDNPHRDIPLVTALSSPVFGFTADDLAAVRAGQRTGDFYDALCAAAPTLARAQAFLRWLAPARQKAQWLPLRELVRQVYEDTNMEAVFGAMEGGAKRRVNLQTFLEFASAFGGERNATLMELLDYVEDQRRQGMSLQPGAAAAGGAVQIMSIHKSKGLEFPVVILADLSRRFNTEDQRQNVMTHPKLFAASGVVDQANGVRFPTVGKKAIALQMQQESLSEEQRVLYVAMTRAKERLIMTYCSKYLTRELEAIAAEAAEPVEPDFAARARNPGWWVLSEALCRTEAGELFAVGGRPARISVHADPWLIRYHAASEPQTASTAVAEPEAAPAAQLPEPTEIWSRLEYRYPYAAAATVPSKLTATQLKGRQEDREASEEAAPLLLPPVKALRRPNFVTSARGLSPTERGTANHLFLQFARYEACRTAEGIAHEVRRMVEEAFLTAEQADAVAQEQIQRLFRSDLGRRILSCGEVRREMKFSILVDAGMYYKGVAGEQVMLQGVVDCLLLEPEGLTVIDFKTDRVAPGGEAARAQYYAGQIRAYGMALNRIYRKPVRACILYFLQTGSAVSVPLEQTE